MYMCVFIYMYIQKNKAVLQTEANKTNITQKIEFLEISKPGNLTLQSIALTLNLTHTGLSTCYVQGTIFLIL